jgi:hypothetical protein
MYYVSNTGLTNVRNGITMLPHGVVEPWGLPLRVSFIRGGLVSGTPWVGLPQAVYRIR